jgi:hypothetical protein
MLTDVLSSPRQQMVVADPPLPTGYAKEFADLVDAAVKPPERDDSASQAEPNRRGAYQYD